ncbi:hypothetical protein GCM10008967_36690 [Bacillus carboniphilus]|uniref:Nudix hydrolase domain-containing protein n=1 Tax=Bacillus carboniphilus TaxID=86663 RepID=A0ABN0WNR2_9BACI
MGESFEDCCKREILEETGYQVEVLEEFYIKNREYQELGITAEVHYFIVKAVGGDMKIQDPDMLIYEIAWKSIDDIDELLLTYPEDLSMFQDMAKRSG